ncbi:MAG: alkaline phosphatase family protein [Candidatus Latescibacterota bacterium]|nr:MAG: alkaline phosphatase family protein [Candidatus Latescibacterota bacterium]
MKTFLAVILFLLIAFILVSMDGCRSGGPSPAEVKNVVILGVDGMDPQLLERFAAKGRMPNFERLMSEGSYSPLVSSTPPQSPVAWSNFITGTDPGSHGIFDFIHCDHDDYMPTFSAALVEDPEKTLRIGSWVIPLSSGRVELLRRGDAFWQLLDQKNIPYLIFRIPSNFPPVESRGTTTSGMGTPDLLGTYGTFSFYTDDPSFGNLDISGGQVISVTVENDKVETYFLGPENTFKVDKPSLREPLVIHLDRDNKTAKIIAGDDTVILSEGEWSDWITLEFEVLGKLNTVSGIVRLYLKSFAPYFQLYSTPININPADPALPISTPPSFCKELYDKIGYYYTQGMPEDTKALEWGVFNDAEFIEQVDFVFAERMRMLDAILDQYRGGLLFFYFSTLDQSTHMLWRNMDPKHPAHTPEAARYINQIENYYARLDSVLGVVRERLPENTLLIAMSDHGFGPFYKKFHLNTWLYQNGYVTLRDPSEIGQHPLFRNVFWRRTRAFGLGINGLYINLRGRDDQGSVKPGEEYDQLVNEITEKLLAYRDPETGEPVVKEVYRRENVYHGEASDTAPDLVVGFHRGYRGSDESALGGFGKEILTTNLGKWTGDHCIATDVVPGIIASNYPILAEDPALTDFTATILNIYEIDVPEGNKGRPLFDF